jgi:hypothetical protein
MEYSILGIAGEWADAVYDHLEATHRHTPVWEQKAAMSFRSYLVRPT